MRRGLAELGTLEFLLHRSGIRHDPKAATDRTRRWISGKPAWLHGNSLGFLRLASTMQQGGKREDTSGLSTTLDVVEILVVWALEFRLQVESGRGIHAQHAL